MPISSTSMERVINMVWNLENLADVTEIVRALSNESTH
jgi:hypothetical protein